MATTWTRSPANPAESVGTAYTRGDYRVQRLGKREGDGWVVWHGADFLGPVSKLHVGKALTWDHEIGQAWTDAKYEYKARGLSDWNLRQAVQGALVRRAQHEADIYQGEIDRREAAEAKRLADFEAAVQRALVEYTMHAYRPPFSGNPARFNHIMAPGTKRSLCGSLHGGPGQALDIGQVDCLLCIEQYLAVLLDGAK